MAHDDPALVTEPYLNMLEARIDDLIKVSARLKNENLALRKQQAALLTERASLISKHEQARNRLETMIQRLKILEEEA